VQADQARGLGWDAVHGDQLLLLAYGAEEPQGVAAEAEERHRGQRAHARQGACRKQGAFAQAGWREQQERQRQAGGELDADARHEGARGGPQARLCAGAQGQRGRQREQDQGVVVGAAEREHEQHRVEPHEGGRPARRPSEQRRRARDERDRAEARDESGRLERPQATGEPERGGGVAAKREQRPVGGVLVGPAQVVQDRIGGRFGGNACIRVQPVKRAHAREAEIAEHVLGYQRRTQQQGDVRGEDGEHQGPPGKAARGEQDREIAAAHHERERLEAARAQALAQTLVRTRKPARPASAAGGNVLRGFAGGAGRQQKAAADETEQGERSDGRQKQRRATLVRRGRGAARAAARPASRQRTRVRRGHGGLHRTIVAAARPAAVRWAR